MTYLFEFDFFSLQLLHSIFYAVNFAAVLAAFSSFCGEMYVRALQT